VARHTRGGFRPLRLRPFLLFVLGLVEDASLQEKSPVGAGSGYAGVSATSCAPRPLRDPDAGFSKRTKTMPHMWRLSDAGPCRSSPQPPGPASESPQGRNPREAGHPELHNAMRISPPPSACERLAARPERCAGLGGNALRQLQERESGAGSAGSRLAGAPIAPVAMHLDERRRGLHVSGGEDGRQSVWKRLRSCS